ncbi:MAG: hypothetical protein PHE89_07040 [Alphaproteobacteria bacterium]|nr:hypothetical protein [Alphaproteobacteria bacterium]
MAQDKEKIIERIRRFKNKMLIGGVVAASLVAGKAKANEAPVAKSDSIKHKKEIKAPVQKDHTKDEKTLVIDSLGVQKADSTNHENLKSDTLSIQEYNARSIEKADASIKAIIAMTEDFKDKSYLCSARVRTFGYGTTDIGRPVRATDKVSKFAEINDDMSEDERRDAILSKGMEYVSEYLKEHVYPIILENVNVKLEPNEVTAISSLIYNIGKGNFTGYYNKAKRKQVPPSPVLIALNEGAKGEDLAKFFFKHSYTKFGANKALGERRGFEGLMIISRKFYDNIATMKVGGCYSLNLNKFVEEDVSSKARFSQAIRKGWLTLKTDDRAIDEAIESLKPQKDFERPIVTILPNDTVQVLTNKHRELRLLGDKMLMTDKPLIKTASAASKNVQIKRINSNTK